ncbi:MAG: hypothetical protein ACOC8E_08770 [Planctomycetota bacterium]
MTMQRKWIQTATVAADDETGALLIADEGGLPVYGTDAAGQDAHAKVLDCPARVTHHLIAFVETSGALLSLDGGASDHVFVPADGGVALDGLAIPAGAEVHAKNAVGGSNFANLRVMVW